MTPQPPPAAAPPRSGRPWAALVLALGCGLYAPTLGHGFVFDDDVVVVRNQFLRSLATLPDLVARTEWSGGGFEMRQWRPLTSLTFAANYAAGGLSPWGFHLVNVLLHGLASLLVLALARRLGLPLAAAALAGVVFAAHPIHVEAVANVTGRKDVLATIFVLATALSHREAVRRGGAHLFLPILALAAAMFSKEIGVVAPALALLADLSGPEPALRDRTLLRRRVALVVAYTVAVCGYLLLFRAVTGGITLTSPIDAVDNPAAQLSTIGRIATALAVVGKGLLLQVFPVGQSPDWSFDAIPVAASLLDPRTLGTLAVVAAWIAIGVRWRAPVVLLSAGWYLIALLPTSNLLFPVGTIFGERLLYLPSVGFALLCGAVGEAALRSARARSAFTAAAALAVGILAVATLRYASAWKDEGTLFRLAAAHVPRSAKVHLKLGAILLKEGRFDEARVAGEEAVRICPNYAAAWGSLLSRAYRGLGRRADEEAALLRAVALAPADADALYGLSRIARESGRIDEAVALLRTALSRSPNHGDSLADLAAWHLSRGETELALPLATRAVEFEPGHAAAWYNLGLIHQARGDAAASRAAFARFVEVAGAEYEPEVRAVRAQLATSP